MSIKIITPASVEYATTAGTATSAETATSATTATKVAANTTGSLYGSSYMGSLSGSSGSVSTYTSGSGVSLAALTLAAGLWLLTGSYKIFSLGAGSTDELGYVGFANSSTGAGSLGSYVERVTTDGAVLAIIRGAVPRLWKISSEMTIYLSFYPVTTNSSNGASGYMQATRLQ